MAPISDPRDPKDAADSIDLADRYDELHMELRREGRFDEAIEARRVSIDAGYRSTPDPEADIAEILVEAGRRAEGDALFAELRLRAPDDVWLYNSAGYVYGGIEDEESLRWCLDGLAVALATGDPDKVARQLLDMVEDRWQSLGREPDTDLVEQVEAFISERLERRVRPVRDAPTTTAGPVGQTTAKIPPVAYAWFPAGKWALARRRWPDLADLPEDPVQYSHRLESILKQYAAALPGGTLFVAPLTVDDLVDKMGGDRAGTAEGRAERAAQVLVAGGALAWPPARNDRCWCGSSRKYKQCCGPIPTASDD